MAAANSVTLQGLITAAQSLSDQLNSDFVSQDEWIVWANVAYGKLYDLLISAYGTNYEASQPVQWLTNRGQMMYPLPDGVAMFWQPGLDGSTPGFIVAPPFYKLLGVDINFNGGLSASQNNQFNFLTLTPFMMGERNRNNVFQGGGLAGGGVSVLANAYSYDYRYRLHAGMLWITPQTPSNFCIQMWYAPELTPLVELADVVTVAQGWEELIELDMAIKAMVKEESDPSVLVLARQDTIKRVMELAAVRDAGGPDYIRDVYQSGMATGGGWGGFGSGFGSMGGEW